MWRILKRHFFLAIDNMAASQQHPARRSRTRNPRKASKTTAALTAKAKAKSKRRLQALTHNQRRTHSKQQEAPGRNANDHQKDRLSPLHEWQKNLGEIHPEGLSDPSLIVELQKNLELGLSYYTLPLIPLVRLFDELRGRSTDGPQRMVNMLCDLVERIISCVSMVKRDVPIRNLEKMLHDGDMLFHTAIVRCVGSGSHPHRHSTLQAAEHVTVKMAFYHERFGRAVRCMPQCIREKPGLDWKQAFFPMTKDYLRRFSTEPEGSRLSKS